MRYDTDIDEADAYAKCDHDFSSTYNRFTNPFNPMLRCRFCNLEVSEDYEEEDDELEEDGEEE